MRVAPVRVGPDVRSSGTVETDPLGAGRRPAAADTVHVTRKPLEVVGVGRVVLAVGPRRAWHAPFIRRRQRRMRRDVGVDGHGDGVRAQRVPAVLPVGGAPGPVPPGAVVGREYREPCEPVVVGPVGLQIPRLSSQHRRRHRKIIPRLGPRPSERPLLSVSERRALAKTESPPEV